LKFARTAYLLVQVVWIALAIGLLYFTVLKPNQAEDSFVVFGWGLILLTFPLGWIALVVVGGVHWIAFEVFTVELPGGLVATTITWAIVTLIGYFQWFVWLPRLVRSLRRRWSSDEIS